MGKIVCHILSLNFGQNSGSYLKTVRRKQYVLAVLLSQHLLVQVGTVTEQCSDRIPF